MLTSIVQGSFNPCSYSVDRTPLVLQRRYNAVQRAWQARFARHIQSAAIRRTCRKMWNVELLDPGHHGEFTQAHKYFWKVCHIKKSVKYTRNAVAGL